MALKSVTAISDLTGFDRQTIKVRLESKLIPIKEGRSHLYETKEAFRILYQWNAKEEKEHIDYNEERARLTHHQANVAELNEKEISGELVKVEQIIDLWTDSISNAKTKLLSLPSKLTHQLLAADSHKDALVIFKDAIKEVLQELESGNVQSPSTSDSERVDTAA